MAGTYVLVGPNATLASLQSVTDGSTPASGQIGELLSSDVPAATTTGVGATTVYGSVTSLSLSPGRWILYGNVGFKANSATMNPGYSCGVSASATGVGLSVTDTFLSPLTPASLDAIVGAPSIFAYISVTTTYFLNSKMSYSAGSPQHYGKLYALRIG